MGLPPRAAGPLLLVATLVLAATACRDGFFFQPPAPSGTLRLALSVDQDATGAAGGLAEAFDAADGARVRLLDGAAVVHDERVALQAEGDDRKASIRVEVLEETELRVHVELRQGDDPLFSGEGQVVLNPGRTRTLELDLAPIGSRIRTEQDSVEIRNLGFSAEIGAVVLFATGDTVTGAPVEWSSQDPEVVQVSASGQVTSTGFGTTAVLATSGSLSSQVAVTVVNPCEEVVPVRLGTPVEAAFTRDDCFGPETDGRFGQDLFTLTADTAQQVVFQAAVGDAPFDISFRVVDDNTTWAFPLDEGMVRSAPVALGPGDYTIRVLGQNLEADASPYTVHVFELPTDFAGCPFVWSTPGGAIRGVMDVGDEGSPYPPPMENCRSWDFQRLDRWGDRATGFIRDGTTFVYEAVAEVGIFISLVEGRSAGQKLFKQVEVAAGDTARIYSYQDRRSFSGFGLEILNLNSGEVGGYDLRFRELDGPPPGSSIAGLVVDAQTQEPIRISWVHYDGPTRIRVRPDSVGMFDAFGLAPGEYTLTTEDLDYQESVTHLTLGADEDVFMTLELTPVSQAIRTGPVRR